MADDALRLRRTAHDYAIAVLLFLGFASLIWLLATAREDGGESPLSSIRNLRNAVVVQDQAIGSNVVISYAALSDPSYVTILQEPSPDGRILAVSRLLPEGEANNFRIAAEGGLPNGTYKAVLRRDDGDERFDAARDVPVRDEDGEVASAVFTVFDAPPR